MEDYRAFFFSLFSENEESRRRFLKEWHCSYPVDKTRHRRLADVFKEFIYDILYERVEFKMRHDHFCFFGKGTVRLAIRYEWLKPDERNFIVYKAFAERKRVFKSVNVYENMHFKLDGFLYNPSSVLGVLESHTAICSVVWQREIVRDFVWLVLAKRNGYLRSELVVSLQELLFVDTCGDRRPQKDVFLGAMLHALQSSIANVYEVPCWGLSVTDIHPEDAHQQQQQETIAIRSTLY